MVVQHNISAMTANRYYGINNSQLGKSLEKLASGYAINRAGDNAAGLAVSEKMRAQIGGLTQASKNAEDGISLVQTMEGALQETDSILQRMRTLAVQSANGSYQDDVDRDAIQLEFDQLNDELNQIADTDFNGVVMLNGGKMADGLIAHDGKFDYATKKEDVTAQATDYLDKDIADAQKALTKAEVALKKSNYDLSEGSEWNTVDTQNYNKSVADELWKKLSLTSDDTTTGSVDLSKGSQIGVTFKATAIDGTTGEITWSVDRAEVSDGVQVLKTISGDDVRTAGVFTDASIESWDPSNISNMDTSITGTGGFNLTDIAGVTGADMNVVFDAHEVKVGDTVTINFGNTGATKYAPTNIGFNKDTVKVNDTKQGGNTIAAGSVEIGTMKDSAMTEEIDEIYSAIEDAKITATYANTNQKADAEKIGITIEGTDGDISNVSLTGDATTPGTVTVNGKQLYTVVSTKNFADDAAPSVKFYASEADAKADKNSIFTLNLDAGEATDASDTTKGKSGTFEAKISVSAHGYSESKASVSVTRGDDKKLGTSNELKAARDSAQKALVAAQNKKDEVLNGGWEKIQNYYSSKQSSSGATVSVSDSLDNSKAKMTYTDSMSLQVGARTKDLVNFTFSYSSDDLGGLEKNLNCSARTDGLNTANLSVSTQADANDAIDQIDKALNKVNMVRATFGAVQNRLEHKIANLDTNNENLTAAESRIRDTQMDKEMMKFTSAQILSQASQSMLAQANSLPQGVLQLLG